MQKLERQVGARLVWQVVEIQSKHDSGPSFDAVDWLDKGFYLDPRLCRSLRFGYHSESD